MSKQAVAERVGKPLIMVRPSNHQRSLGLPVDPHGTLTVVRSVRLSGDFPNRHATVTFDFAGKGDDMVVHLVCEDGGERTCALWNLKAVEDRDAKGIVGFAQFAESLEMKGYQLAHLIAGLKPA